MIFKYSVSHFSVFFSWLLLLLTLHLYSVPFIHCLSLSSLFKLSCPLSPLFPTPQWVPGNMATFGKCHGSHSKKRKDEYNDKYMEKEVREREGNWKNSFPQFGNGKGMKKNHSQNWGMGREWKNLFPKFGNGKGMEKIHSQNSGMEIRGYHSQEYPGTGTGMKKR